MPTSQAPAQTKEIEVASVFLYPYRVTTGTSIGLRATRTLCVFVLAAFLLAGCAPALDADLESGQLALSEGDWDAALSAGQAALQDDPQDAQAALVISSAYAGRSGFKIVDLMKAISDSSKSHDLFDAIQDGILSTVTNFDDLRQAIVTLTQQTPFPLSRDRLYRDHRFQAGILMAIEALAMPSIAAQPAPDAPIDENNITPATRDLVQEDFIACDKALIDGGLSPDDQIVKDLRQTYCVLKKASTSPTGIDLPVLRDLVRCQLSSDDGAHLSGVFESPTITSCSDFDYTGCENAGPIAP